MKAELIKLQIIVEKDKFENSRVGWFKFVNSIGKIDGYLAHAFCTKDGAIEATDCRGMEVNFEDWLPHEN